MSDLQIGLSQSVHCHAIRDSSDLTVTDSTGCPGFFSGNDGARDTVKNALLTEFWSFRNR